MLMFYILIFQELIAIDIAYFNFLIGLVNLFKLQHLLVHMAMVQTFLQHQNGSSGLLKWPFLTIGGKV